METFIIRLQELALDTLEQVQNVNDGLVDAIQLETLSLTGAEAAPESPEYRFALAAMADVFACLQSAIRAAETANLALVQSAVLV